MATEPLGPQAEAESGHPAEWVNRDGLTAGVGKRRILLTVSYDGTAYAGWQRQLNAMSFSGTVLRISPQRRISFRRFK